MTRTWQLPAALSSCAPARFPRQDRRPGNRLLGAATGRDTVLGRSCTRVDSGRGQDRTATYVRLGPLTLYTNEAIRPVETTASVERRKVAKTSVVRVSQ